MDQEAKSLAKNTQNFIKDQLRVTQPGMLHSHMNLFKEQIKNPWPVILQTLLSHKQLRVTAGPDSAKKAGSSSIFCHVLSHFNS